MVEVCHHLPCKASQSKFAKPWCPEIHNNNVELIATLRELDITAKRIKGMFWILKYIGISGGERESVALTLPGIALFWSTVPRWINALLHVVLCCYCNNIAVLIN